MKGKRIIFPFLVISTASVILAAEGTNILKNGSFEYSTEYASPSYGWSGGLEVKQGTDAEASWEIDSASGTAKDGKNFLRINVKSISTENWHVQLKDPTWLPKMNYIYHFSMWARADAAKSALISVYGNQTDKYAYRTSSSIALTAEWKQFHQMFISDADSVGKINFAVVLGGTVGVYDIDGVVISEIENTEGSVYANGDFEADGAGWSLYQNAGAATATYPEEGAKSGKKFCRVEVTEAPDSSWKIQLQDGSWTSELNGEYTFTFWSKASEDGASVHVAAHAGSSRDYGYLEGTDFTLSTEWTEYTYTYLSLIHISEPTRRS
jgi:hypothetical protein